MTIETYKNALRTWTKAVSDEGDDVVVVFHKPGCPFCEKVFEYLQMSGSGDKVISVDTTSDDQFPLYEESMEAVTQCSTVPKVFQNGVYIGDSSATCLSVCGTECVRRQ